MKVQFSITNLLEIQHQKDKDPLPFSSKPLKYHILDLFERMNREEGCPKIHIDYVVGLYYSDEKRYKFTVAGSTQFNENLKQQEATSRFSEILKEVNQYLNKNIDAEKFGLEVGENAPVSIPNWKNPVIKILQD